MTIVQIYNSYYKHIPWDVFNAAVESDTTSYNQEEVVKVGNFVKWILKLYSNGSWKPGDSYETRDLLTKFIKYKSKLPIEKRDINRYISIHDLYSIIQTLENEGVKTQSDVKREGTEVVYEDSEWKIVIPHTEEASCIYGAHTRWCTAGRERNMFDYYNKEGLLYININKVTGDKYQFHFESDSFMDAEDKVIFLKKIGLSKGAIEYYNSIGKEHYFIYDEVYPFHEGFSCVYIEGKGCNFINTQGELLWKEDKWFDTLYRFSEGFATVYKIGKGYNFINTQGELLWKEYKNYDIVYKFTEGFAFVKIEGRGYNFINTQGELVWKEYKKFDKVHKFHEGFAGVYIEGLGYNFINKQGELLWKEYKNFDYVYDFHKGFTYVELKGKGFNFINTKGELLWKEDKWFDNVFDISNGYAIVYNRSQGYNLINSNGELVLKEDKWFDYVYFPDNGLPEGELNGKWFKLNTQGELIFN